MAKIKFKITIKGIVIGAVVFICITAFMFSFNWERYHPEYKSNEAFYYSTIDTRNSNYKTNRTELREGKITVEEFFQRDEAIYNESEDSLKEYHKRSREIRKEHKFLGRSNFKFWFDQYFKEFRALFFIVLALYLYKRYALPKYVLWSCMLGIATSIFIHYFLIFKTASDFYDTTYMAVEAVISLLAAFLIVSIIQWISWKQSMLSTLRELFGLVFEEEDRKEYVKEEKKDEFRKRRVEILHKRVGIKDKN